MLIVRIAVAILFVCFSSQALAEKRVALVIGNSAYQHVPELANPRNDAADMVAKLEGLGFEVVSGRDLDLQGVRNAVRTFAGKLEDADMALFFYAGHGLQVNSENYIAPVDAKLSSYLDLDFETVPINLIMSAMERSTRVNLVFLDACRDNPLAGNLSRSMGTRSSAVGRGLAKLGSGIGSLISYATQPGNVALDGSGRNSPFTTALLKHLGTPGRDITRDLVYVRRDVLDATGGKQVPWDNSSLTGDVILKQLPKAEPVIVKEVKPDNTVELAYWDTIKDANDKELIEVYLKQYPKGAFAPLARAKLQLIDKRIAAEAAAKVAAEKKAAEDAARQEAEKKLAAEIAAKAAAEQVAREAALAEAEKQAKAAEAAAKLEVASLVQPSASETIADPLPEAENSEPDRELVRSIQKELNRVGCSAGTADGLWGNGSRRALEQFAKREKLELAALEPTSGILDRIKTEKARVCPLVCARNQQEKNGRCIEIKREVNVPKSGTSSDKARETPAKTKKTASSGCPGSALAAAKQTLGHRIGGRDDFTGGTHACGKKFICYRMGHGGPDWKCSWS